MQTLRHSSRPVLHCSLTAIDVLFIGLDSDFHSTPRGAGPPTTTAGEALTSLAPTGNAGLSGACQRCLRCVRHVFKPWRAVSSSRAVGRPPSE
eukprot:5869373-Alexandrium_andersonii.AAC.1